MNAVRNPQVRQATLADVALLAPLFDAYRQFYGQASDVALAQAFLSQRLTQQQSTVFLAQDGSDGQALGFAQLYPSFSSVSAAHIFILNDLFVVPTARRLGVGTALLQAAAQFGREAGALRLVLSTAEDNTHAQALYAAHGWVRDTQFLSYSLSLS